MKESDKFAPGLKASSENHYSMKKNTTMARGVFVKSGLLRDSGTVFVRKQIERANFHILLTCNTSFIEPLIFPSAKADLRTPSMPTKPSRKGGGRFRASVWPPAHFNVQVSRNCGDSTLLAGCTQDVPARAGKIWKGVPAMVLRLPTFAELVPVGIGRRIPVHQTPLACHHPESLHLRCDGVVACRVETNDINRHSNP